jgi:hypothetical protein
VDRKISDAIMTIIGTLPIDAEMRFYWQDGCSHLSLTMPGRPEQIARLNRSSDGTGVLVPSMTH